ncbi:MAG: DNA polymerase I [Candidatus Omnitrophica bacterium]|nr:DNA polymerase I [Candidatus Omnitrophota bacterium]
MTAVKSTEKKPSLKGKTLFIFDGTAFCYRAYYAIRNLSTSKGEATNAIYGFITMLDKFVADWKPDYMAICFDRKEPTFRHEEFEDYKANRKPAPDDLVEQLEPIKDFCRAYHYAVFEKPGFEADDLFGTLAARGELEGLDVYIVTSDKDALQLVTDKIKIVNPSKEGLIYDTGKVRERFDGLGPEKILDLMALMGDASDNIPGVPGIGEKTAIKLIKEFGSAENLLKYASKVKSKSQQALLKEHHDSVGLSKKLATIDTAVEMAFDWDQMRFRQPDQEKLFELCKRYEFRKLTQSFAPKNTAENESRVYSVIETETQLEELVEQLKTHKAWSFDTETTSSSPHEASLVGMSFSWKPFHAVYLPVSAADHNGPGLDRKKVIEAVAPLFENKDIQKYGQNVKYDLTVLKRHGVPVKGIAFDTMIASYLINPVKLNHNLDDIALEYLAVKKVATENLIGKGKNQIRMDEVPLDQIAEYAAEDADVVFRLVPALKERLQKAELEKLFDDIEMPLAEVLEEIENNGVKLDLEFLRKLSEAAGKDLERLTLEIYEKAGREFNINSTKQLSEILFVEMKLPVIKKTKTGFSTDVSVLEKLALNFELPKMILEYREKAKLKSTYLDALPQMVNSETGKIHTSYHQTVTSTGRLSSSDPNLQNIPIKTREGREVRRAFISRYAENGGKILSADYSQIELRLLAHLSGDKNLVKAFKEDRDIHSYTATLLYGVKEPEVTREMRTVAKTINFSIIYGKTAYGLSQDLGISISEADRFIKDYFERYDGISEYLDAQKEKARTQGYLTTLFGRRAYFPDINARNVQMRQFAERAAINAPLQGSAADLIKAAMIQIQSRIKTEKFKSLMIMQVHDELVFDAVANEVSKLASLVKEEMEKVYPLNIPLRADVVIGDSWYKE